MPRLTIQGLREKREDARTEAAVRQSHLKGRVIVHMGTCGNAAGARDIRATILDELDQRGIRDVMLTAQDACSDASHALLSRVDKDQPAGDVVTGVVEPPKQAQRREA